MEGGWGGTREHIGKATKQFTVCGRTSSVGLSLAHLGKVPMQACPPLLHSSKKITLNIFGLSKMVSNPIYKSTYTLVSPVKAATKLKIFMSHP